ncbi:MAG: BREX-3 system phosphatase PglZ [Anaerolineae bacterium]
MTWREQVLDQFVPGLARLTLVADPDGLLLEEGIREGIVARGFELMPFEDQIAFRYDYESRFRSRWDRGEDTNLAVVLRTSSSDLSSLPFDLLQAGRRLSFSLGEVFPHLSYPVVAALDRDDLDALYVAQEAYAPGPLGANASKEFILRHVFGVAPELIKQPADLMRVLLRRHYRGSHIPTILDDRFIQLLRQGGAFPDWPLEAIVPDREAFLAFIQERWPIFLDRIAAQSAAGIQEPAPAYALAVQGPVDLPFGHHDIRVFLDNLFLEGILHPVPHVHAQVLARDWMGIGICSDSTAERPRRLARLMERCASALPAEDAKHGDWLRFARWWAELTLLANQQDGSADDEVNRAVADLQVKVDTLFAAWLRKRYAGLINLPPVSPTMLHHLPRFLARHLQDGAAKVALLMVDGLALDQWLVVREALARRGAGYRFREDAVFAWVPSITSVSRQATFAGRPPAFFPGSIQTTDKEPALWTQFWTDQGLAPDQVVYLKGLGDGSLESVKEVLAYPKVQVAGLVIDKVDKIMHGMEMGAAGMVNQVRQWAQQAYLGEVLELLLDRGFLVFLTSDHGNVEAVGCGQPAEGAVADLRGERARIYADRTVQSQVKARFPDAIEWEPTGLPQSYLALLAPARQAFVRVGERVVTHGGISVEELIVPLIEIDRRHT